ncbi:hypothetical protein M758_12G088700 [Ceratodon purpureus]|nr:hypothetical protein M758_12G088700 [Ceratodon purpureus]
MNTVSPSAFLQFAAKGNHEQFKEHMERHLLDIRDQPEIYAEQGSREVLVHVYYGRTPLHLAAMHGHLEIMKLILRSPRISVQIVNARDHYGYTPLHLAVRSNCESAVQAVRLLTNSGWLLPDRLIAATCNGSDCELEHQCGLQYGSCKDEESFEYEGYTPLHVAVFAGKIRIVQLLLRRIGNIATGLDPVSIHAITWRGKTPLDIAYENQWTHIVELIESSDLAWMQSERERNANSVNAILVGAALVVAVTFNCWQQPPLGIPDSAANVYSHAEAEDRTKLTAMFFMSVSPAFTFSVAALVVGTLAIMPSKGADLKKEVKHLRSAVRKASSFLIIAILFLIVGFHLGGALVYEVVAFADLGWFSFAADQIVHNIPFLCLLYIFWLVFKMKRVYGWITRSVVLMLGTIATMIHVLEYFGHLRVLLLGTTP